MWQSNLLEFFLWILFLCDGVVSERLYGPRYRPLWKKGAYTKFTTKFGPSSIKYLIESAGFGYENYTVPTEDEYLLNLNRMTHPDRATVKDKGFPLLLVNGFMMHSDAWLLQNTMDSNIAPVWSALGYDVWLGDQRGSLRSRGHVKYDSNRDKEYWQHSTEEIGVYDIAAFIDFILKKTGYKQLVYMCVSMGCSYHAILISSRPEYNEKILGAFYFSPLVNNIQKTSDMSLIYQSHFYSIEFLVTSYLNSGNDVIFPHTAVLRKELFHLCRPFTNILVPLTSVLFNGAFHTSNALCSQLALTMGGGSVMSARHLLQLYKKGEFAKYDYGRIENMKKYDQDIPPLYDMKKITSFVALYYSDSDELTFNDGANRTLESLSGPKYVCEMPGLSHFDVNAGATFKYIFPDVNAVLNSLTGYSDDKEKHLSGRCPSMEWTRNLKN